MAPTFLDVIASEPTLWPDQYSSVSVSLAHINASNRHELQHFALIDMLCAMTYGLPQILDYDTSTPAFAASEAPVHGFHADLQIALADINKRCAQGSVAHDWQSIELRVLDWRPPVCATADEDAWKTVAQLAVDESWRHTILIYLYMVGVFLFIHGGWILIVVLSVTT